MTGRRHRFQSGDAARRLARQVNRELLDDRLQLLALRVGKDALRQELFQKAQRFRDLGTHWHSIEGLSPAGVNRVAHRPPTQHSETHSRAVFSASETSPASAF